MRLHLLVLLVTVSGCIDGHVDSELEASSTTEEGGNQEPPEPTTGTSTGTTGTTGADESTSVTSSSVDNENQPLEVALSLSHTEISQARTVVVTTTSKGADTVRLLIWETTRLGEILREIGLPPGKSEYEHEVLHGPSYFYVVAERDGREASYFAELTANLPDPGTFEQTLGPQGTGAAIVLHANDGVTFDQPTVIGHDLAGNVVFLGQPSPYPGARSMEVTSAAMDKEGAIYVGGSADGQAVVRKYKNRHLYWEYAPEIGVVHDILVDDGVVAVGEVENAGVASGAYWRLSKSGGLVNHHVWEGTDEQNEPLGSVFNAAVWKDGQLLIVGSVAALDMASKTRAAVFDGDTFSLCDVDVLENHTSSTWLGVARSELGFVTVGFEQVLDEQPRIRRSTFAECSGPVGSFLGADGRGRATSAATTFVGEEIIDGEPYTYIENSFWNHRGELGTGAGLAVDRHGYVHVAGTV
ncbi:MAG: hypothetical protein ACPG77_11025, partial [Nannocystaceae bacterium]